jgi:hypothetical protein
LVDFDADSGYGLSYGSFTVPFSAMTSNQQVFSGSLLSDTAFPTMISPKLKLRLYASGIGYGADVLIDRIDIFPTKRPVGFPTSVTGVIGSYAGAFEQFDINTGVLGLDDDNTQPCPGGAIVHSILYLLKENSMYSTQDVAGEEPSKWSAHQVSNVCGTCGIHSYAYGRDWLVTACRSGVYGFNGGEPMCISPELAPLWDAINWTYGHTIWTANDIDLRKMWVGIPIATPNKWLPDAPVNANPTSPNVILHLDYTGLENFNELVSLSGAHVTMFGTVIAVDLRRKWTIHSIASPYAGLVTRAGGLDMPLYVCNGESNGKIYTYQDGQLTDDGAFINWLYTTYGFISVSKAKENPIYGFHNKRYVKMQITAEGSGYLNITVIPNDLNNTNPRNPNFTVYDPPILQTEVYDYVRNLNVRAYRAYVQFSPVDAGTFASVSKLILVGNMDPHSPLPQVPGR